MNPFLNLYDDLFCTIDLVGNIIPVHGEWQESFGSKNTFSFRDIIFDTDQQHLLDKVRFCVENNAREEEHIRLTLKDGSLSFAKCLIFGQEGVAYASFSLVAKKEISEKTSSWTVFENFLDGLPGLAFIKNDKEQLVYLNKAFEDYFGIKKYEWLGRNSYELFPEDFADQIHKNDRLVLDEKNIIKEIENCHLHDGTRRDFLSFKFPLEVGEGKVYLAGFALDIEASKDLLN